MIMELLINVILYSIVILILMNIYNLTKIKKIAHELSELKVAVVTNKIQTDTAEEKSDELNDKVDNHNEENIKKFSNTKKK